MHGEQCHPVLLSCLVLAALVGLSEAGWERVCSIDDATSSQGVCGKQLAQMLSLVCGHRGYQGVEKRSDLVSVKKREAEGRFFLPKQAAHEFLSKRGVGWQMQGKFFRGITCECCQHRCSLPELTQYCAEPLGDEKRTLFWPKYRKRSTGSDVTDRDRDPDRDEHATADPTTAQKTSYRNIRPVAFRSIQQQLRARRLRSS